MTTARNEEIERLLDTIDVGVFETDSAGAILSINAAAATMIGVDRAALRADPVGLHELSDAPPIVDSTGARMPTERFPTGIALRDGITARAVIGTVRQSGRPPAWFEVTAIPSQVDGDGTVQRVTVTMRDIGSGLWSTHAAADLGGMLNAVVDQGQDFVVVSRPDGDVRYVSPSVTACMGWTKDDLAADRGFSTTHPDDLPALQAGWASLLDGSCRSFHTTHRSRTVDGRWIWVDGTVTNHVGEQPIDAIVSHVRDVTELFAARTERDALGRRMETMFGTIDDLLCEVLLQPDGTRIVEYMSPNYWRVAGRDRNEDLRFEGWGSTVIDEDRAEHERFSADLDAEGVAITLLRSRSKQRFGGEPRWLQLRGISEPQADGVRRLLYLVTDVTDHYAREDELVRLSRLLEAVISNVRASVLVVDDDDRVLLVNRPLSERLASEGFAVEIGSDASALFRHMSAQTKDPDAMLRRLGQLLAVPVPTPALGEHIRMLDGTVQERDMVPIEVEAGRTWRLWVTRDVTDVIRSADQLERARRAAEASSRQKTRFLATMSHEIRTPLNGIIGMLELMQGEPVVARRLEMLDTVRSSADALLAIINDVLEITQIEEGRVELAHAPFDARVIAREVRELFAPLASRNDVRLHTHVADDVPLDLVGDAVRIRQLLVNLVDNAVRHTPSGRIDIEVGLVQVGDMSQRDGDVRVRFAVRDTGIGVSLEVRDRLFDAIPRAAASTGDRPATGLGLSICNRLVDLLGGNIRCRSTVGVGSTFEFEIPLARGVSDPEVDATATAQSIPVVADEGSSGWLELGRGRRQVLVVEDNEVNREVLTRQLDRIGCAWVAVDNGEDALAALAEGGFDGVLMDCQMRGLDGYDTTRRIRALAMQAVGGHSIPVIAVTASAYAEDRARCLAAGMDDVLAKPVRISTLRDMLDRRLLRMSGSDIDLEPSRPLTLDLPERELPLLDRAQVDELRDDLADDSILARSMGIYLSELETRIAALLLADSAGDLDLLARAAHELRSTSSTFGAAALAAACVGIEAASRDGDQAAAHVALRVVQTLAGGTRIRVARMLRELGV